MAWIFQPWPWYIAGPLIGLTVPLLLLLTGKSLGISSSFRHLCSLSSPKSKLPYLRDNPWRQESWNLIFVAGIAVGGFLASHFLSAQPVQFLPDSYYSASGVIKLLVGGVLVGFGTRYADGCTSGHTIMGLSNLRWPSLVASICFFIGGLVMTALGLA
ncbi:MAG: YeeE/YedE family protein [Caldilineaceae bacterium]|nr:YeeE/YedE family protein [Caldilineaceae bacterium]